MALLITQSPSSQHFSCVKNVQVMSKSWISRFFRPFQANSHHMHGRAQVAIYTFKTNTPVLSSDLGTCSHAEVAWRCLLRCTPEGVSSLKVYVDDVCANGVNFVTDREFECIVNEYSVDAKFPSSIYPTSVVIDSANYLVDINFGNTPNSTNNG